MRDRSIKRTDSSHHAAPDTMTQTTITDPILERIVSELASFSSPHDSIEFLKKRADDNNLIKQIGSVDFGYRGFRISFGLEKLLASEITGLKLVTPLSLTCAPRYVTDISVGAHEIALVTEVIGSESPVLESWRKGKVEFKEEAFNRFEEEILLLAETGLYNPMISRRPGFLQKNPTTGAIILEGWGQLRQIEDEEMGILKVQLQDLRRQIL